MKINVLIQQTISSECIVEVPKDIDPDDNSKIQDWIEQNWQNWEFQEFDNTSDWVSFDQVEAE